MRLPDQRYVSKELTHFVGSGKLSEEQYQLLLTILRTGELRSLFEPPAGQSTSALGHVPKEIAPEIPAVAVRLQQAEQRVIDFCRSREFSVDKLRQLLKTLS